MWGKSRLIVVLMESGDHMEGYQQGSGRGRERGKVQRISSINGR